MDLPIACSLEEAEMGKRLDEWHALVRDGSVDAVRIPHGVRLVVRAPASAEFRKLMVKEQECCAWVDWSLSEGEGLVVEATHPTEMGARAIREMVSLT
jgi:hypothetical protein